MTVTLTPELHADLRKKAEKACEIGSPRIITDYGSEREADAFFRETLSAASGDALGCMYGAPVVLALLDRIEALEKALKAQGEQGNGVPFAEPGWHTRACITARNEYGAEECIAPCRDVRKVLGHE